MERHSQAVKNPRKSGATVPCRDYAIVRSKSTRPMFRGRAALEERPAAPAVFIIKHSINASDISESSCHIMFVIV